jgi:hypothetical protein
MNRKTFLITCKNCDSQFEGKFCSNCGQSADTHRLDLHFLAINIPKLLFSFMRKGIFYTVTQLFTRPGNSIRGYVEGKRVNHYEPFAMLVTIAALYGLLYH